MHNIMGANKIKKLANGWLSDHAKRKCRVIETALRGLRDEGDLELWRAVRFAKLSKTCGKRIYDRFDAANGGWKDGRVEKEFDGAPPVWIAGLRAECRHTDIVRTADRLPTAAKKPGVSVCGH